LNDPNSSDSRPEPIESLAVVKRIASPGLGFLLFSILTLALFLEPLSALVRLALSDDRYSHIPLTLFLSLGLIYLRRRTVFSHTRCCPTLGLPLLALASVLYYIASRRPSSFANDGSFSCVVSAIVLVWVSGFVLFLGFRSCRSALAPLSLLLLFVPIPPAYLETIEVALQKASAEVAFVIFKLTGMPVFRQGLTFSLPGVDVQVARECSGIRSSIALLLTAQVAGLLFLRSNWRRACLVVLTIPISIFKNALRIATISWLGVYVSKDFFYGNLHRRGGLPFSLLALALLAPFLLGLQRSEAARLKALAGAASNTSSKTEAESATSGPAE
jgi:exosortase